MLKKLSKKKLVKTPKQSLAKKFQDLNTYGDLAVIYLERTLEKDNLNLFVVCEFFNYW